MTRRLIPLPEREWSVEEPAPPLLAPGPIAEMERLAAGLAHGDLAVALEGRRRLQNQMSAELQRMVGEFVCRVESAESLYEKIGQAIAIGRKLEESRPPQHYIDQCADPEGFTRLIRTATDGLVRFVAAEINYARTQGGEPPLTQAMVEALVRCAAQDLHEALEQASSDASDRLAQLALVYARTFDTGAHVDGAEPGRLGKPRNGTSGEGQ